MKLISFVALSLKNLALIFLFLNEFHCCLLFFFKFRVFFLIYSP